MILTNFQNRLRIGTLKRYNESMSFIQKLLLAVLPGASAKSMEAESREWIYTCPCGHTCSVWDLGGVRWKAAGTPGRVMKCPRCGKITWQTLSRTPISADSLA
jgi:hypothetical protein